MDLDVDADTIKNNKKDSEIKYNNILQKMDTSK